MKIFFCAMKRKIPNIVGLPNQTISPSSSVLSTLSGSVFLGLQMSGIEPGIF